MNRFDPALIGDVATYRMDFSQQDEIAYNDETLLNPSITYNKSSGLTIGVAAISSTEVYAQISVQALGDYILYFQANTSGGSTIILPACLPVITPSCEVCQ